MNILYSNDYMKTKKALAGLLGLLGSLAAALLRPAALAGFLATESLINKSNPNQKTIRSID